jgi:hypothetical protein
MRRPTALVSLLALCGGCTTLHVSPSAHESPTKEQSDLSAIHRKNWTDWREVLESPEAAHDPFYGPLAQVLKHSVVPTEQDAITRAIQVGGSVDMRTTWEVSALLRLADDAASRPDKDFGKAGDFVWEVRVKNFSMFGGTVALVWVSTTTGKTKVLHP